MPADPTRETLGFDSDAYELMLRSALQHYSDGEFANAETILRALVALAPDDARPFKMLGGIKQIAKRYSDAEELFETAMRLDPNDPYILVALAEIKLHSYEIERAVALLHDLFQRDPKREHPATRRGHHLVRRFLDRMSTQA